jgi:hypothetical protein
VFALPTKNQLQKSSKKKDEKKENWFDVERNISDSQTCPFSTVFLILLSVSLLYSVESVSLYICALPFFFFFFLLKNYHLIYCVCVCVLVLATPVVWLVCQGITFTMKTGALQKKAAIMCRSISAIAKKNRFLN